ncbi:hypothetical protein JCM14036_12230 [Desulfotomaculum defluvii]
MQLFTGPNFGPLLLTDSTKVPSSLEKFLWSTAPDWWVTPAEGPFNHTYILGDLKDISYGVQGRVDFISELRSYISQMEQGVSGSDHNDMVMIAEDDAPEAAIYSSSWTAHAGSPTFFVTKDGVPEATRRALSSRPQDAFIYLLGDDKTIPPGIALN